MKPSIQAMENLPVEVIKTFRKTGKSIAIPKPLQQYILELDRASEIFDKEKEHNISRAATKLQETFPELAHMTARKRIYDAINYFHINSTVKEESWNNYFADRMEDLSKLAVASDNITEARRCMEKAREYRQHAIINSINPEDIKPHIFLISPDVDAERLGLPNINLKSLWKQTSDFINDLPVDSKNKEDALKDASGAIGHDAEDVDYEDL